MTPEEIEALANHVWTELSISPDIAQALEVIKEALEKVRSAAWTDGYVEGLYKGLLIGARELCIYCANNHPVEPEDDINPCYLHTFKDSKRVYICAASDIWRHGGYKLK